MPPEPPLTTPDDAVIAGAAETPPPVAAAAAPVTPACQNCEAPLTGPYCAQCGQRADTRVPTLTEVGHDVVHSLLHLDGRVLRTLRSLVLRPGELTREFLAGRRQRYLPPFRLYLVISLAFFALSSLLPDGEALTVGPGSAVVVTRAGPELPGRDAGPASEGAREAAAELGALAANSAAPAAVRGLAGQAQRQLEGTAPQAGCSIETGWGWLDGLLAEACAGLAADGGRRLGQTFLATTPKLMFLFLPLMAAVAMLFYWQPRRLYAEHLVLFLHTHALVFLWLIATSLVDTVIRLDVPGVGVLRILNLALMLYLPWYVYRAMRSVYGESRWRTAVKLAAIGSVYFVLLGFTMILGLVYSLLSL